MSNTAETMVKKRRASGYRLRGKWWDFSCAVPALIFFVVFTYYPIVSLFNISLTDWNLMRDSYKYVGLKNYQWLFAASGWKS